MWKIEKLKILEENPNTSTDWFITFKLTFVKTCFSLILLNSIWFIFYVYFCACILSFAILWTANVQNHLFPLNSFSSKIVLTVWILEIQTLYIVLNQNNRKSILLLVSKCFDLSEAPVSQQTNTFLITWHYNLCNFGVVEASMKLFGSLGYS